MFESFQCLAVILSCLVNNVFGKVCLGVLCGVTVLFDVHAITYELREKRVLSALHYLPIMEFTFLLFFICMLVKRAADLYLLVSVSTSASVPAPFQRSFSFLFSLPPPPIVFITILPHLSFSDPPATELSGVCSFLHVVQ